MTYNNAELLFNYITSLLMLPLIAGYQRIPKFSMKLFFDDYCRTYGGRNGLIIDDKLG